MKLIALAPDGRLHRDEVLEALWPELSATAATNNLHRTLHALRQLLPELPSSYLRVKEHYLVLGPPAGVWVDVHAFVREADKARRSHQVNDYEAALAHYGGELLPGDYYQDWIAARREELRSICVELLMELASLYEDQGNYVGARDALQKLLEQEPALEAVHQNLIRLYLGLGQPQAALRQYARLREVLQRELDAEPDEESQALYQSILNSNASRDKERPQVLSPPQNLPPTNLMPNLTSFVGREVELAHLSALFTTTRLLTLRGAPGCGKSRLAREFALGQHHVFRDGVWHVELSEQAAAEQLPATLARALGLAMTSLEPLKEHMRDKALLLVLDNTEHLASESAQLVDLLLKHCPKLKVLVTGCSPLGLPGEVTWRVPPLSLAPEGADLDELQMSEAIQLFLDRARLYRPAFSLTPELAPTIHRISQSLDGLPLAIELLAPKLSALSIEQIAARLSNLLNLLRNDSPIIPLRHHSYEAALDRSYRRLGEEERSLFVGLANFTAPFTLEDLEDLYGEELDALSHLTTLVNTSLVAVLGPGSFLRYRLLEPIRQYAFKRLKVERIEREPKDGSRG